MTKHFSHMDYDGVVLRLVTTSAYTSTSYLNVLQAMASDFEIATGARVQIDAISEYHSWYYLLPLARADADSNEPRFDLFLDDHEFQYSLLPILLPLDDLIEAFDYDMSGFVNPIHRYGDILPGGATECYGLPFRARVPMVFYRNDWIDTFPTTWEEFDRVLAENTGGERYGLGFEGVHYAHPFCRYEDLSKMFFARYWSLGDPLLTPDWKPLINSDKGVAALTMLKRQLQQYAPPDVMNWTPTALGEAFADGRLAVVESVADSVVPLARDVARSQIANRWSVGLHPGSGAAFFKSHRMSIFKHSKHPEAAFAFAAYCTGNEGAKRLPFYDSPARRTVLTLPETVADEPNLPHMIEAIDRGIAFMPGVRSWVHLWEAVWYALALYMPGYTSAKAALDVAANKWERILARQPPDWEYRE